MKKLLLVVLSLILLFLAYLAGTQQRDITVKVDSPVYINQCGTTTPQNTPADAQTGSVSGSTPRVGTSTPTPQAASTAPQGSSQPAQTQSQTQTQPPSTLDNLVNGLVNRVTGTGLPF